MNNDVTATLCIIKNIKSGFNIRGCTLTHEFGNSVLIEGWFFGFTAFIQKRFLLFLLGEQCVQKIPGIPIGSVATYSQQRVSVVLQ